MKKLFLIIIISIASISVVRSQDFKYEIGAGAGIGFYMGDINPSKNISKAGSGFRSGIPSKTSIIAGL